jgi:cellulose synthase/poly-beta-1,6-N-acetylglucosamine synthase-like glycosyltransferase
MSRKKKSTRRIRAKAAHLSKSPSVKAKRYNPSLPDPKREPDNSCTARYWKPFTWFCTLLIPDAFICKDGPEAKQAWREKVTIFEIMIIANLIFLFVFGVVPLYFCRENTPLSEFEQYVDPACTGLQYAMFGLLYFVAALMLLQCICSMIVGINSLCLRMERKKKPFTEEDLQAGVMIMVPCYNEGDAELRKTIKSILNTDYPDENKVLVVVADGIITGRGEWINTPRTLANLLGFELSKRDKAYSYKSIGTKTENKASLYHGTYENNGRSLKYIVIVKRGTPEEKESTKPGNRGKRDSQLITLGLFNRVHHDRRLNELDEAICRALNDLQIPAIELEYLLAIDADTRVSESSVSYMVHSMDKNRKVLACCGETKVDNKTESWVTMIQVYEYFASHMLKKAFESVFGCVTCLPGCFTMYRMFDDDWRPLVSHSNVAPSFASLSGNSLLTMPLSSKNIFIRSPPTMSFRPTRETTLIRCTRRTCTILEKIAC